MNRKKATLLILVLLAVAVLTALPFVRAERFRSRIHAALERSLGRTVLITGSVTFGIWNGPGFSITNVVIQEDPAAGIEPFAYVAELDTSLNLWAMLRGRWEVSRIVLVEPTVNLVKLQNGSWNIRPLLTAPGAVRPDSTPGSRSGPIPEIRVRAGRLNLKFGDTKSVLYMANADLEIEPSDDSSVGIRFRVEPARTDRPAQGIGTLSGRGRYRWFSAGQPSHLELDLDLERSAISDLVSVLEGRGAGMRGFLATSARLEGPLDALRIEGRLRLDDIDRWDLLRTGSGGDWPIRYRGTFEINRGLLNLDTAPETSTPATAPFRFRLRAQNVLENPAWGAILEVRGMPVATLREVLQSLDVSFPSAVAIDGNLSGVLSYSPPSGLRGLLDLPEASITSGDAAFQLRGARLTVDGDTFRLGPALLDLSPNRTTELEAFYAPGRYSITWRTGAQFLPISDLSSGAARLLGVSPQPFSQLLDGQWRGALTLTSASDQSAAAWSGQFSLRAARLRIDGFSAPVTLSTASGTIVDGNRIALDTAQGTAEGIPFSASRRNAQWRISAPAVDLLALEKLFLPTLKRSGSLLRTLTLRSVPTPEWLRTRKLTAAIYVGELSAGDHALGRLRGLLEWDGTRVELRNAVWDREGASARGGISLRLNRAEPQYRIDASLDALPYRHGAVTGEAQIESSGTGGLLLRNAKVAGNFTARDLLLPPDNDIGLVTGAYELSIPRGTPVLKLTGVSATSGLDTYTGQGASEGSGRFTVDLASGPKKLRLAGTMWPFDLEAAPLAVAPGGPDLKP
jgi:hypothetical protein